jgi:hypothetical protein
MTTTSSLNKPPPVSSSRRMEAVMISSAPNDGVPRYARDLLLSSAKRIRVIEL